ncbi:MAG TPA: hypothetical protein PK874_02670 [Desulfobacteraceae bacterium]|nr:hypothetical protein [Desulfobacteraceae bacterium]HPJ69175.1 hypothetical protein [Desulfobacteraceae bacterium]HPQ29784.1 hypothetical protein [Desulfobacteraceae bacterium]
MDWDDWDDEFDSGYDDPEYDSHDEESVHNENGEVCLDPTDINSPVRYFLLSDDAQDEISRSEGKNMKCLSCGHRFRGDIFDRCPKCFSMNTQELSGGQG